MVGHTWSFTPTASLRRPSRQSPATWSATGRSESDRLANGRMRRTCWIDPPCCRGCDPSIPVRVVRPIAPRNQAAASNLSILPGQRLVGKPTEEIGQVTEPTLRWQAEDDGVVVTETEVWSLRDSARTRAPHLPAWDSRRDYLQFVRTGSQRAVFGALNFCSRGSLGRGVVRARRTERIDGGRKQSRCGRG